MKSITIALCVLAASTAVARAQEAKFEFMLSGALVPRLEPDTRVQIWSPVIETKPNWAHFRVKDMPVTVPYKQLAAQHIWIASFISPAQRRMVFSLGLSEKLFDKPRKIGLVLDRPTATIALERFGRNVILDYRAWITEQLWYEELPLWDKKNQRLVPAGPPTMSIVRASDGGKVLESAMSAGCMGAKWCMPSVSLRALPNKTLLKCSVRYDSGGLWEPIETTLNFTYAKTEDDEPEAVAIPGKETHPTPPVR